MTELKIHYGSNDCITISTDNVFAAVTGLKDAAIHSPCGGRGTCGKCKAVLYDPCGILKEAVPLEADAEFSQKYHIPTELVPHCREVLLCRLEITENTASDVVPEIFLAMHEQISAFAMTETEGLTLSNGIVSQITVTLDPPTKEVPISVADNIKKHTGILCRSHYIIKETAKHLRNREYTLTFDLLSDGTCPTYIAGVLLTPTPAYGIAVDIGTTTVALSLWNLTDGVRIDETGCENPQRSLGSDVISRMSWAEEGAENPSRLKTLITERIADLTAGLAERNSISKNRILYVSAAGNSVMEHMFLGLSTASIARSPFYMETALGYTVSPAEAGLDSTMNPGGRVYLAPLIASYVGGDISMGAAYLLDKIQKERDISDKNILFMDLGTNGEIGLFSAGTYRFAATAAGPCLEGANIEMGMCAAKGAVSKVRFTGTGFETSVIGGGTPTGICGSGIIDAVAALLESGLLDEYGSLTDEALDEALLSHLCEYGDDGRPAVHITPEVVITTGDIRQVQTAKAAIAAGVSILLKRAGITADDIDEVYLAGSFGGGINTDSAVKIGLLPDTKCKPVSCGNTSAKGAAAFMMSESVRNELADIMARSVYTELSADPDFNDLFIGSMLFGQDTE